MQENKSEQERQPSATTDDRSRPVAIDFKDKYLEHLEKENAFLRDQNTVLLERVKETNILTQGLQKLLTPFLRAPSDRAGDTSDKPLPEN